MAPKLEDLNNLQPGDLLAALDALKRPQLQAIAKKCGVKANLRTLELVAAVAAQLGGSHSGNFVASQSRLRRSELVADCTPNNPVFNPRYAPTPSTQPGKGCVQLPTASTVAADTNKTRLLRKSKQLRELEAALQSIRSPGSARFPRSIAPPTASTLATGTKRKGRGQDQVDGEELEQHPKAKKPRQRSAFAARLSRLGQEGISQPPFSRPPLEAHHTTATEISRLLQTPAARPEREEAQEGKAQKNKRAPRKAAAVAQTARTTRASKAAQQLKTRSKR